MPVREYSDLDVWKKAYALSFKKNRLKRIYGYNIASTLVILI